MRAGHPPGALRGGWRTPLPLLGLALQLVFHSQITPLPKQGCSGNRIFRAEGILCSPCLSGERCLPGNSSRWVQGQRSGGSGSMAAVVYLKK